MRHTKYPTQSETMRENAEAFAASGGWATGTIAEFCERYKVTESERRALGLQLGALRFRAAVEAFEKSPIGEPSDGVGARVANRKDDQ